MRQKFLTRRRRIVALIRESLNGVERDYTQGSIRRAIVLLSIPMVLEMAMESLFAVVDAWFVAKISIEAVATVGLTESILTLIYAIGIGLSAAATAMVSRRVGEGRRRAAGVAGAQVLLVGLVISTLLAIPGYLMAPDILSVMTRDKDVQAAGLPFVRLMLSANLPVLLLWMLNGIFRGAGDANTAMRALWLANGVNLVLDPLLIFGMGPIPAMGLLGAGIATTIGRSAGVAYQLWHLFGVGRSVRLYWRYLRPRADLMLTLLRVGAGSTGQYLIASASWIFLIYLLGQIGKEATAGYTIAIRIVVFSILPAWGIANAASTLTGQNLGAGQPERAATSAWLAGHFCGAFMLLIGIIYLFAAPGLIGIFTDDASVKASGALSLRIMSAGYLFYGYGMVITQSINGAGDTLTPTLLNFVFFWLIETPLAWLLAFHLGWGEAGVYWSIPIAESGMAAAAMWYFRTGRWKKVRV
ncbi:MAG: MATE family efflux transporter [Saprospiraceae bacterium]